MRKVAQTAYSGPSGAADLGVTLALAGQRTGVPQTIAFWGVEDCPPDRLKRCAKGGVATQVFSKKYGSDWEGQGKLKSWMRAQSDASAFIVHYPASLIPLRSVFKGPNRPRIIMVEHNSLLMKRPHHWVLSALAFLLCDGVVYLTESYRKETARRLGPFFRKKKATVIANGLDLDLYPRRDIHAWRDDSKPFVIGMSGRMAALKDYDTLLRAYALLLKKHHLMPAVAGGWADPAAAPRRIRLEFAGDGPLRSELETQVIRLGIRKHVTFTGLLGHADLLKRMATWDAFVLSTHGETQPLALMEAMAIGLPCAATDVPGVNDLIVHGENGLVAPKSDSPALFRAMDQLLTDNALSRRLAEAGNKVILHNYSAYTMWDNYRKFIDSINNK
jgi:glycosyltransferase involved in cell wall biosynthesis